MYKKILEFDQWSSRKIAVLHMKKSSHDLSGSLKEVGIPHVEFEQGDMNLAHKITTDPSIIGLIIGGGVLSKAENLPELPLELIDLSVPKMGICLGHEILGVHLGSRLIDCNEGFGVGEFSEVVIKIYPDPIYAGLEAPSKQMAKMEHFYMLDQEPPGAKLIASSDLTPVAAFHHEAERIWGFQFHPEKDWMKYIILKNFYKYCLK